MSQWHITQTPLRTPPFESESFGAYSFDLRIILKQLGGIYGFVTTKVKHIPDKFFVMLRN
jgi:hypothetical protein